MQRSTRSILVVLPLVALVVLAGGARAGGSHKPRTPTRTTLSLSVSRTTVVLSAVVKVKPGQPSPAGAVAFYESFSRNGRTTAVKAVGGAALTVSGGRSTARLSLSGLRRGKHVFYAVYKGSGSYLASMSPSVSCTIK